MGGSAGTLEASLPGPPVQGQGGRASGQAFHRAENAPAQQGKINVLHFPVAKTTFYVVFNNQILLRYCLIVLINKQ